MVTTTEVEPIFVVGSARAGTSALVAALRDAANIPCDHEGHLVPLIHLLLKASREHTDTVRADKTTVMRVGQDAIDEELIEAVKRMQDRAFPGVPVWLDKTPDGPTIRAIPYILKMWPKTRFVFAKRRGIENIVSRMRKFPHLSFKEHCERWVISMNFWRKRRDTLPKGSWIEIEQREMSLEPQQTAQRLCSFLKLSESVAVRVGEAFATIRPESTGGNERVGTSIDSVGWSKSQIETYRTICSPVALEWGYSEDENYYSR